MRKLTAGVVALCSVVTLLSIPAPPAAASGWDYDLALYLFALGLDGRTVVRGREADVDVSFSDIVEDLEMAATGHFEAAKRDSRWGWFGDVNYSSSGQNFDNDLGEYDLDMIYIEGAGTYRFGEGLQVLAGAFAHTQGLRDLRDDQGTVGDRREWHEEHAIAVGADQCFRRRQREPGLASATRPGERHAS